MTIERDYGNGNELVEFFTGTEVEHSPAFGLPTLFVVGLHDAEKVLEVIAERNSLLDASKHIKHVYFGANMSFDLGNDDGAGWTAWDRMIEGVLEYSNIDYATLDLTHDRIEGFLESILSENNRVIPMVSVKLPYTKLLNYNTTIKIDDNNFNSTNPGVWCHSLHDLMDRKCFTPWSAYKGDNPVNQK